MEPNYTFQELIAALQQKDRVRSKELLSILHTWVSNGGTIPWQAACLYPDQDRLKLIPAGDVQIGETFWKKCGTYRFRRVAERGLENLGADLQGKVVYFSEGQLYTINPDHMVWVQRESEDEEYDGYGDED